MLGSHENINRSDHRPMRPKQDFVPVVTPGSDKCVVFFPSAAMKVFKLKRRSSTLFSLSADDNMCGSACSYEGVMDISNSDHELMCRDLIKSVFRMRPGSVLSPSFLDAK